MRVKKLLLPSPFKVGCLVVICSVVLFFSFGGVKPRLLQSFDNRCTDALFHIRGPQPTSSTVVIVDIDNDSLARYGQWPWSRHILAQLMEIINRQKPRAIMFDFVFPEPDRTSPSQFLAGLPADVVTQIPAATRKQLQEDDRFNHDLALGQVLANSPSVLGYALTMDTGLALGEDPFPSITIKFSPTQAASGQINLLHATNGVTNIADIAQAESEGFFNVYPGLSGTIRKVPLFMEYNGLPYPSLALEGFRIGNDLTTATIHLTTTSHGIKRDILGVQLGTTFLPTDEQGQLTVNFRGPSESFPYISAADILSSKNLAKLKGRYILIGSSAAGLLDLRATPFSNVMAGVEIHANLIDNMVAGDPMTYDTYSEIGLTYCTIIIGGLALAALLAYSTPIAGALGGVLLILISIASAYLLFMENRIVGITYPLFSTMTVFFIVTLFNYFFTGRDKRFLNDAFKRYVSPAVVKEMVNNPKRLSLSGETKSLTIFFSDIRDFTSISEELSPKKLSQLMNEYLTAMTEIIMQNGGTVDKFIGDAIMAIWGAPLDIPQQELLAVRTSLLSLEVLEKQQPTWQKKGYPHIDIGIGLNSGPVRVGNFGSERRFNYTVLGDNVNLAARLEGLNKTYGSRILISEYTKRAVEKEIFCRYIDRVRVKGKEEPVRIYEPLCEQGDNEKRQEEITLYNRAMYYYQAKKFGEAHSHFQQLASSHPHRLYSLYQQRSHHFMVTPPENDWDGVYTHTSK